MAESIMLDKAKEKIPQILRTVGFIINISGIISLFVFPPKMRPVTLLIMIVGLIIGIIPQFISNRVYVCPKCKAQFEKEHSKTFIPLYGIEGVGECLNCPKCYNTSFCRMKFVLATKYKDNK